MDSLSDRVIGYDLSDDDFKEEEELCKVLSEVVQTIRYNKNLEQKVRDMDLKISLIVRNHLTTRDLLCQNRKGTLTRVISTKGRDLEDTAKVVPSTGLGGHCKESQLLLESYQHLFYLLQTDPRYITRLIFSMTQDLSSRFIESVVYNVYNCGSTTREECLMLQLFGLALKEDIERNVDKLSDIGTGGSFVLKRILFFYKTGNGLCSLQELLQPVVEEIVNDESLFLSTNPVDVYKHWVNEQETIKGQMLQIPYDLSEEQALKIPEVIERINKSIESLQTKTNIFVNRIIEYDHLLPYGICYVCKVLFQCLTEKFPEASEIEIMKCVSQVLYYSYIIATIPAADTFGVISLSRGKIMHIIQRKNLGAIAKVLHHGAAFQLFEPTNRLSVLNNFLVSCHQKFMRFLQLVCSVEDPEVCFEMDAYSEATLIRNPEISLTAKEIVMYHELLITHRWDVAPDAHDMLHQLLDSLDPPMDVDPDTANDLITLSLSSKGVIQTDIPVLDQLFINTEQLVVQFLQCQSEGKNLVQMLKEPSTQAHEERFQLLVCNAQHKSTAEMISQFSNLSELKNKILHQLVQLEMAGFVSSQNGYQDIIDEIEKKAVHRDKYRAKRKLELAKLHRTLTQLKLKTQHHKDTLSFYSEYIQNCLRSIEENLRRKAKRKVRVYSAHKLLDMGILLELVGVELDLIRLVTFEISTTDMFGVFSVTIKLPLSSVKKTDLDIQHLLRLQYEGESIIELLGFVKISLNLLLLFLNKKFLASF